jgi:hypothetical protein
MLINAKLLHSRLDLTAGQLVTQSIAVVVFLALLSTIPTISGALSIH